MAIYFEDIQGDVASIFLSYFQRAPEFEAMQHYVGVLQALQANPATAGNAFNLLAAHIYADGVASQEVPAGPTVTDAWYVSYLYSNVLGRAPDAEGLAYWVAELEAGNIARAELVGTFVAAALASEGRDAAYLENRTEVAVEFAQWENSNPQVLPTLKYNAAEVLLGVNEDPATVVAAQSRLETSTGVVGETRNLTPEIDTIEGTTGNDTFNAVFQGSGTFADSTLTTFDSIDGDLGVDTFNIYVGSGGANGDNANDRIDDTVVIRNVEIVNIYNGGNAYEDEGDPDDWDDDYVSLTDASRYEGVQQLWQIGSESNVTNVGADTVVGFRNITAEQMWADVTLAAGVSSATIALDNVGSEDDDVPDLEVDGNALSTVNVVGALNADADHLDLAVRAGKDVHGLTVSTAVDTHLFVAASGPTALINSLDLSGSTGDVLFAIIGDQADELVGTGSALTVAMGAGDDTIVFGDRALSLRDSIDGGEGDDTLALAATGRVQTQTYDAIARTTNFENVAFFNGSILGEDFQPEDLLTTVEVDAAQLEGFDSIIFGGIGIFQVSNLSSDVTLEVSDVAEFGLPGIMAVMLDDAAADVNVVANSSIFALLVGGDDLSYLDINELALVPAFDDGSVVPGAKGATGGTLSFSGEEALAVYTNISGKFSTISTDEFDGILALAGMSKAVAETVVLGADTMAAIYVTVGPSDNSSTLGLTDVIEGFTLDATVGGEDVMGDRIVTDDDIVVNSSAKNYSNLGSLQEALAAAAQEFVLPELSLLAAEPLDTPDLLVFVYGDDTYIFGDTVNPGGGAYDNGDFLLKLAGVTDAAAVIGQIVPFDDIGGLGWEFDGFSGF